METTTATTPAYKVDWIELELSAIVNRYGWEATLNGLQSLLPLGETLGGLIEAIEDQKVEDLTEECQYKEWHDRAGYRSDCF